MVCYLLPFARVRQIVVYCTNLSSVHGGALCPLVEVFVDVPIVAAQDGGEHRVGVVERVCEGDGDGAKEGE